MDDRPKMPAELRRQILIEAGHRCAIPTCRHIEVDVHHIIPWEKCKKHSYENLIALCPNCHRRAGRNDIDRKSLRTYKSNLRFAHDKFSQLEIDILFELNRSIDGQGLPWPAYQSIMIRRIIDAKYVELVELGASISIGNIKTTPDILALTLRGRQFIESLGLDEL